MYPKSRNEDIVVQEMGKEILVYDLKTNRAVCLNETAAIVWRLCNGKRAVSEIADEAGKQMKSSVDENLISFALDQLKKDGLLSEGFEQNERFPGLSRREVIRKVGLGAMVALPIVSSIVAPRAVAAQSGCTVPVGVCITAQGFALCAVGCAGRTINFTEYSDSGCATILFPAQNFVCPPTVNVFTNQPGTIVNSVT